ncbi:MAG: hypothetical protein U9Q69_05850, partial [Nanoarchaeota archaeon]|nr:hypothetical protein [Nanoarchaeota archaeon]
VEEEEPVKVCKETDNGNDPKNAGTTYLYYDGTKDAYVDFCDKDNLLHEYYCADSQSLTKDVIKCSGKCLKGKCVSGSETTKTYRFLPAELLVIDVPSKLKIKNDVYSISIKNGEVVATKIDKIDKGPSEGTIDKKSSPKLEESRIDKPVAPKPKKSVARPKTFFSRLFTGRFSSLTGRAINIFPFLKKWRTIKTGTATPNKPAKPASATNKPDAPKPDMDFNKVVSLKNGAVLGDFKLVGTVVGPKKVKLGITCLKTEKAVKLKRHKKYLSVSTVANAAKPIKPASPAIGNPAKPIKPASPAIDNPAKPIKPAMPASRFSLRKLFQGISGRFFAID